jgi:hypothetical protein
MVILPRIFLDFPFSRKVLWEQVTSGAFSVSLSVPIENRNFEGMLALPLTPYPTLKRLSGQGSTAYGRATARGRAEILLGAKNRDSPIEC